jgi:hypothetical protein
MRRRSGYYYARRQASNQLCSLENPWGFVEQPFKEGKGYLEGRGCSVDGLTYPGICGIRYDDCTEQIGSALDLEIRGL